MCCWIVQRILVKPARAFHQLEAHAVVWTRVGHPLEHLAREIFNPVLAASAFATAHWPGAGQLPVDALRARTLQRPGPVLAPGKQHALRGSDRHLPFGRRGQTFPSPLSVGSRIPPTDAHHRMIGISFWEHSTPATPPVGPWMPGGFDKGKVKRVGDRMPVQPEPGQVDRLSRQVISQPGRMTIIPAGQCLPIARAGAYDGLLCRDQRHAMPDLGRAW